MTSEEYLKLINATEEEIKNEEWRDVAEYEGLYQVSNLGRVKSLSRFTKFGRSYKTTKTMLLRFYVDKDGYMLVGFSKKSKMKGGIKVHQLVLLSFGFERKSNKLGCCHGDGCRYNNRIENLRWGTQADNVKDQGKHGRFTEGEKSGQAVLNNKKVIEIRELYRKGEYSQKKIGKIFGVSQGNVGFIVRRITWKHI